MQIGSFCGHTSHARGTLVVDRGLVHNTLDFQLSLKSKQTIDIGIDTRN